MLNRNTFDNKYGYKGGVNKMVDMINNCARRGDIAKHFGVSNDRVRQWCNEMGLPHPNYHRCMTIKEMLEVYERGGRELVDAQFADNRWYDDGLQAIREYYHVE